MTELKLLKIIDGIKLRIYWIERVRYALTDEEINKLEEVWDILSKIDNDAQARC